MVHPSGRVALRRNPSARRRSHVSFVLALAVLTMVALLPTAASGQPTDPTQVQNLTVTQQMGFATLAWTPVADATEYQITRTPVDADGAPTGAEVNTGVWRAQRQINQSAPTFADSGFPPGERFSWRVRARIGTVDQAYSDPVVGTTVALEGPDGFFTQFEQTQGAQFTSHESEIEWTERIDAASDRVRVVTLGHTVQGRPINLFIIGYPAPPATAEAISASPTTGSNCNVHGNEPSGREACFMMIRKLAFSNDPWVVDILSNATVLIVPSINGDGRASNSRGNATGQDLNRDYGRISQPETQAIVRFFRDYTPEVINDGHEHGSSTTCDVSYLNTPQLNNAPSTHDEGKEGLIEGWMYSAGAVDGWWPCPYPAAFSAGGQSFGNTTGHRSILGMLTEARSSGGATRPNEGNTQANRRRKAYSQLWTITQVLDYHRTERASVQAAIAESLAYQVANNTRIVFDGTYNWPAQPAPHPGQVPPPANVPGPGDILEEPPCGYLLGSDQYTTLLADGGSLPATFHTNPQQRLAFHGIAVEDRPAGHVVRMRQPLRGLIPLLLDQQTEDVGSVIITAAQRMSECPLLDVDDAPRAAAATEGDAATVSLAIANTAPDADETLEWQISTATATCDSPGGVAWISADPSAGTLDPGGTVSVELTLSSAGAAAPQIRSAVVCVTSNDPAAPVVEIPVSLQVQYPFSGPHADASVASVDAGRDVPIRFSLDGYRGPGSTIVESVASRQVDCAGNEPIWAWVTHQVTGFDYDPVTDVYRYRWATAPEWAGTCRELALSFDDDSQHTRVYRIRR